jgi:hypothetical protein
MPTVYKSLNGPSKHVKNLGWLQHHLHRVINVEVVAYVHPINMVGAMNVYLDDDRIFSCEWASLKLCAKWLSRPSLHDVKCYWINHHTTCDALKHYHFGGK